MSAAAYFVVSILTLTSGHVEIATKNTKFPTEAECVYAALQAKPFLHDNQIIQCDPGGPDVPTPMEQDSGE